MPHHCRRAHAHWKKMWYRHTVEYYSATAEKGIPPSATAWLGLEGTNERKKVRRERQVLYDITYRWNLKQSNSQKERLDGGPQGLGIGGNGEVSVKGHKFPVTG